MCYQVEELSSRGRWIAKIQEYDLEIKPTKLIKGQGLSKKVMRELWVWFARLMMKNILLTY